MIFERNGQALTKEYFAKLATDSTNEFLGKLGLEERIGILPQEMLTGIEEANQYFSRVRVVTSNIFQPETSKKKGLKERIGRFFKGTLLDRKTTLADELAAKSKSVLPLVQPLIEAREPFFHPYSIHTRNGVIYTPLLEGIKDQFEYWWDNGLSDFHNKIQTIKGIDGKMGRYDVETLPNNTFTLKSLVAMSMLIVLNNLYQVKNKDIHGVVDCLAQRYSQYKSLPLLNRVFIGYNFPKKWIKMYVDDILSMQVFRDKYLSQRDDQVGGLIYKIGVCTDGNFDRCLRIVGKALKKGVKDYSGMVDFLAEKSNQK